MPQGEGQRAQHPSRVTVTSTCPPLPQETLAISIANEIHTRETPAQSCSHTCKHTHSHPQPGTLTQSHIQSHSWSHTLPLTDTCSRRYTHRHICAHTSIHAHCQSHTDACILPVINTDACTALHTHYCMHTPHACSMMNAHTALHIDAYTHCPTYLLLHAHAPSYTLT